MKHPFLPSRELLKSLHVSKVTVRKDISKTEMSKYQRWYYSEKGIRWNMDNAEKLREYRREHYRRNHEKRRAYLNAKNREYRANANT